MYGTIYYSFTFALAEGKHQRRVVSLRGDSTRRTKQLYKKFYHFQLLNTAVYKRNIKINYFSNMLYMVVIMLRLSATATFLL